MTLLPANQHILGTEMMKFELGGIWTDGGTINYGGGISNPHRNHALVIFTLIRKNLDVGFFGPTDLGEVGPIDSLPFVRSFVRLLPAFLGNLS